MATKPPTKLTKAEQKRQRIEAAKAAAARAQRRERNIRLGLIAGAVAAVIAIIVIAVVVFWGSKTRSKTSPHAAIPTTPATQPASSSKHTTRSPWYTARPTSRRTYPAHTSSPPGTNLSKLLCGRSSQRGITGRPQRAQTTVRVVEAGVVQEPQLARRARSIAALREL